MDEAKKHLRLAEYLQETKRRAQRLGLSRNDIGEAMVGVGMALIDSDGGDPANAIKYGYLAIEHHHATEQ